MKLCLRCNQYFNDNIEQCPTDATWLESVGKDPLIGALINDRYLVESVIGKGSSGIVYRATRLGRGEGVVAIKVLHSYIGAAGSALDRFLREAEAARRLRNPHIITIWASGVTDDGQPYFVMDYLEGTTLGHIIREKGRIEPKRVLAILSQIGEALAEAHSLGITHRDLKPENIALQETGHGADYVKLLDFGIADSPQHALLTHNIEKPKTVSGSPAYMSPEQCQGLELDGRSDIYSLAIVAFEMLTGSRPFQQVENVNVMVLHVSEKPMTLSEARPDLIFPAAIENVLARALSKQPSDRQATIQDFILDMQAALEGAEIEDVSDQPAISALDKLQQAAQTSLSGSATISASQPAMSQQLAVHSGNVNNLPRQQNSVEQGRTYTEHKTTGKDTVHRLIAAVHRGQTTSHNNVVQAPNKLSSAVSDANAATSSAVASTNERNSRVSQDPLPISNIPGEDDKTHYVKQQYRNTLSRLEGWKTSGRTRAAIISTRAKAASLKADSAIRPINVGNILLTGTTLLCLGTSVYVIYSALKTPIPHQVSISDLTRKGNYIRVIELLEHKQLLSQLTAAERDQLGMAYLKQAKSYLANNQSNRALLLLTRIDPQSIAANQGQEVQEKLIKSMERK